LESGGEGSPAWSGLGRSASPAVCICSTGSGSCPRATPQHGRTAVAQPVPLTLNQGECMTIKATAPATTGPRRQEACSNFVRHFSRKSSSSPDTVRTSFMPMNPNCSALASAGDRGIPQRLTYDPKKSSNSGPTSGLRVTARATFPRPCGNRSFAGLPRSSLLSQPVKHWAGLEGTDPLSVICVKALQHLDSVEVLPVRQRHVCVAVTGA
jgi:hypothetical protein